MNLRFVMNRRDWLRLVLVSLGLLLFVGMSAACSTWRSPSPDAAAPVPENGRVVAHALGETVVPESPQRVVVLAPVADPLALGVKPIGAALMGIPQRAGAEELSPMLDDRTQDIAVLGRSNQPNLETMKVLEPDLILGAKGVHSGIYRRLSQIAPTVVVDISGGADNWKDYVLKSAQALGKQAEAEQLIQQYEERIEQFQAVMGDRLKTTEVSLVRFRPNQFRLYQRGSFAGAVLHEAGLPRPEPQRDAHQPFKTLSLETIPQMDGDVLFIMQDNPEESSLAEVKDHPLWSRLTAVQQNQVYEVSLEAWFLNAGIVSAHLILNDLFRTLVPDGEQYVVEQVGELMLP